MARRQQVAAALLVVLAALLTVDVLVDGPLRRHLDPPVERWVQGHLVGGWHDVAYALLQAGQRYVLIGPLVLLAAVVCWRRRSVRPALVGVAVLAGIAVVGFALKFATGRTAPTSGHDRVLAGAASFPSGHAINGLVLWLLVLSYLAVLVPWLTVRRRVVIAALTGLAAGCGTLGMGYHWLTDVLAGWVIGALGCLLVLRLDPGRGERPAVLEPDEPVRLTADRR